MVGEWSSVLVVGIIGLLGLAIGSFLNVVIWRVPQGLSVVRPGSACPSCHTSIGPRDNIPVVSWLILRGRCRQCSEPISFRYPAVELLTAAGFVGIVWWRGLDASVLALCFFWTVSVALAAIDLDVRRLPDVIVLPSIGVAMLLIAFSVAIHSGEYGWWPLIRALVGAAVLFAVYFAIAFAYPAGMGMGDVKLAALLGLFLGWWGWGALAVGWFAAFVLGGVFSLALMVLRRAGRKTAVAFGPWMLLGAWLGLTAGESIASGYINLVT